MNTSDLLASAHSVRPRTARALLTDRVLTVASSEPALQVALRLDQELGGLVITGAKRLSQMRYLRHGHPDMILMAESDSHSEHFATVDEPFYLPSSGDNGLLPAPSLEDIVRDQRDAGASAVLLPTGYVMPGLEPELRAIITESNKLVGDDIVVPLYLDKGWLNKKYVEFLKKVIAKSDHLVALAFGSSTNPLDSERKLELYVEIVSSGEGSICWRTDLAGFAGLAGGALAAAIGVIPSQRRIISPKDSGHARRPDDPTPYVLIPDHLHYMKTGAMREELYVGSPAPSCFCSECDGRGIDRFNASPDDARSAERHNLEFIEDLSRRVTSAEPGRRKGEWRRISREAVIAHEKTGAEVGRPFKPGTDVQYWAED